jgi:hypothetical protein
MVALRCVVSAGLGIVRTRMRGNNNQPRPVEAGARPPGSCPAAAVEARGWPAQTSTMPSSVTPAPEASWSGPSSIWLWAAPLGIIGKQFSA